MTIDTVEESRCDDCGRVMDARLLDAVLLDSDGNQASDEAYCEQCWPRHKQIEDDEFRALK